MRRRREREKRKKPYLVEKRSNDKMEEWNKRRKDLFSEKVIKEWEYNSKWKGKGNEDNEKERKWNGNRERERRVCLIFLIFHLAN